MLLQVVWSPPLGKQLANAWSWDIGGLRFKEFYHDAGSHSERHELRTWVNNIYNHRFSSYPKNHVALVAALGPIDPPTIKIITD